MSTKAEKINKLIAKAERTDNPHERETFMAAAQRLMLEWGIEEAVARSANGELTDEIVEVTLSMRNLGTYSLPMARALHSVVIAYGLRGFTRNGSDSYVVVGYKSDVSRLLMLFSHLPLQAIMAMESWRKEVQPVWEDAGMSTSERLSRKKAFVSSFGEGVARQIRAMRKEVEDDSPGAAVAIREREVELDEYLSTLGLKKRGDGAKASNAGREAGARADLGQTRFNHGRKALG